MPASSDRGNERSGGGGGGEAEPEEKTDGWMATYSDMVTLLLTFFVLMVALSNTDTAKMEMFMVALSRDGLDPETFWEIQEKYEDWTEDADSWDEEFPLPETGADEEDPDKGGEDALKQLHEEMSNYIEAEQLGEVISVDLSGDYLAILLASDMLFESGSAQMTEDMSDEVASIGGMIAATFEPNDPFEIIVAGHTDNVPINTAQYPSNWYLSRDRSTNVLLDLLDSSELDPVFFSSSAFGEYRPIDTNLTDEGRKANRRVEILVSLMRNNPRWERGPQPD